MSDNLHPAIRARIAFERLNLLGSVGYEAEWSSDLTEMVCLSHPSKRAKYPELVVDMTGEVHAPLVDDAIWPAADEAGFKRMLRAVPRPTLWDKTRNFRSYLFTGLFVYGTVFAAIWALGAAFRAIFN